MKMLYQVAVLYTGEVPQENPNSADLNFVVCGDILRKYSIPEVSKVNAMLEARKLFSDPDPEIEIFQKSDEIMFMITPQKWDKKDAS